MQFVKQKLTVPLLVGAAAIIYEGWKAYRNKLHGGRRIRVSPVSMGELHVIQRQDDIRKRHGYEGLDDTSPYC